jgi:hypothetical protein
MVMTDARHDMRIHSSEKCELDLDGSVHHCRINDISSSGALVNCAGFLREAWPGDKCVLHMHDQPDELECHISHIAASKIGLRFDD